METFNSSEGALEIDTGSRHQERVESQLEIRGVQMSKAIKNVPVSKCTCKKSQCMKLYCECFAKGGFCGIDCGCVGCSNTSDNEDQI